MYPEKAPSSGNRQFIFTVPRLWGTVRVFPSAFIMLLQYVIACRAQQMDMEAAWSYLCEDGVNGLIIQDCHFCLGTGCRCCEEQVFVNSLVHSFITNVYDGLVVPDEVNRYLVHSTPDMLGVRILDPETILVIVPSEVGNEVYLQ